MKNKYYLKLKNDQRGITSMVVVILIMTLLTLIVLSMVRNANREQRQALDRQLNSQAFYAAESGINDAEEYINAQIALGTTPPPKTDCGPILSLPPGEYFPGKSATIDAPNQISYSCVLYDPTPESIEFSSANVDKSKVLPIKPVSGNIVNLKFSWVDPDAGDSTFNNCPVSTVFPQTIDPGCEAGVLRVELMDPSGSDRQDLIDKNFVAFLKPGTPATGGVYNQSGPSTQGLIWDGNCTPGGRCELTISGIPNKPELLLHLRSIYKNSAVTITGVTDLGGPIEFSNAQVMIDATGKANDVIKRIQVRRGITGTFPEFSLQTTDPICKQIQITLTVNDSC